MGYDISRGEQEITAEYDENDLHKLAHHGIDHCLVV